jgi:UDP-N-acetylglucosamine 1-carboxyvinyltransferase
MQTILKTLGCSVHRDKKKLKVSTEGMNRLCALSEEMSGEAVKSMRSSVYLLGALINRAGEVEIAYPGGCVIGERPLDIHFSALKQMGVEFEEKSYGFRARTDRLTGAHIVLPFPSVGATENVILAAVGAEGITVIQGAAREPEVVTLCGFLNAAGADISGEGSSTIVIRGGLPLSGTEFSIPGDRIVAGTYLCACLAAGGEVLLSDAPVKQMQAVKELTCRMGALWQETEKGLYIQAVKRQKAPRQLITAPYPGFPTDLQSVFLSALALAKGTCILEETIFENRFHTIPYLQAMGARVRQLAPGKVLVEGVEQLSGCRVEAKELRGGAALVVAGVAARGETRVEECHYIERGYENICRDLRELGVRIYGV